MIAIINTSPKEGLKATGGSKLLDPDIADLRG